MCAIQVTQLVAQNLTSTTLPRRSCIVVVSPVSEVKVTLGAALAEPENCQMPIPARANTATTPISAFFIGQAWFLRRWRNLAYWLSPYWRHHRREPAMYLPQCFRAKRSGTILLLC